MVNFDLGYGGTVLQMAPFRATFGSCSMQPNPATGKMTRVCSLSALAQSIIAISSLFTAVGSVLSGFVGTYLGRRGTIQVGCALIIIGAAAQSGMSGSYVSYNVCKSISCIGIGHLNAGSPLFGVEVASPSKRGALVAIYSIGLACGTLCSSAVCYGSSSIDSNWAWRTPVLLQIPLALIYALVLSFFPESPRWLVLKGRDEAARRSFGKFYDMDPNSQEVSSQVQDVKLYISLETQISSSSTWTELFRRSYFRRTAISLLASAMPPICGITLVSNYAAVFFSATGVSKPFLIQVFLGVCGVAGACCGPWIVEYGGRRFAILFGFSGMTACMLIFSTVATGLGQTSQKAIDVLIASICIFFFFYASCVSSSHWLISAEIHSIRLRTYGQAISVMLSNVFTFASAFWTPYMINPKAGNMGTNVGYFYFAMCVVGLVSFFFLLPETARLSLEQIDDYFLSGKPAWKTSIKKNKQLAGFEMSTVAASSG